MSAARFRLLVAFIAPLVGCASGPTNRVVGPGAPPGSSAHRSGADPVESPITELQSGVAEATAEPRYESTWTLERCVRRALAANRGLLDVDAQVESAEWSLAAAESSFELRIVPRGRAGTTDEGEYALGAEVELSQQLRHGTRVEFVPQAISTDLETIAGYTATITQPLLRGRQRESVEDGVDRARFGVQSAERARHLARVDIVLATILAVYRVVQEREVLRLDQESATRSAAHLEAARARERAGLSNSLDVFRATQQMNRAQDALDTGAQAYADAVDLLRLLLALPLDTPLAVDAPLTLASLTLDEQDAIRLALRSRVELIRAREVVEERSRVAVVAEQQLAPDLDLVLSVGHFGRGSALDEATELGSPLIGVGLVTSIDARRTTERAQLADALLSTAAARRNLERQRDIVVQQVRGALRDVAWGERSIEIQRSQLIQAQGKLAVARKKFELNLASNFDVIEAEEDLRGAETALLRAVVRTIGSEHSLRAALGTLIESPDAVDLSAQASGMPQNAYAGSGQAP